jgi:hypothetical protein
MGMNPMPMSIPMFIPIPMLAEVAAAEADAEDDWANASGLARIAAKHASANLLRQSRKRFIGIASFAFSVQGFGPFLAAGYIRPFAWRENTQMRCLP